MDKLKKPPKKTSNRTTILKNMLS